MLNTEDFLRRILGPVRSDIRPLVLAVDVTAELLYQEQCRESDIHVSRDVYANVAKQLNKKERTVAKAVQRLTAQCLNALSPEAQEKILGEVLQFRPSPREMLFYLTYYVYRGRPYRTDNERNPFEPTIAF